MISDQKCRRDDLGSPIIKSKFARSIYYNPTFFVNHTIVGEAAVRQKNKPVCFFQVSPFFPPALLINAFITGRNGAVDLNF